MQGDGVQACVCGCGTSGTGAELGAAACSAWRCPRWASSGRDRVGVQGGRARCGRSCSAAAAGGSAREQRGHAWRTSKAVEEKAADEVRRHCELLVEDQEVAWRGRQRKARPWCGQTTALAVAEPT
jgi:hypothetical protein